METFRDEFGFIEIEKLRCEGLKYLNTYTGHLTFFYDNKKYFFKKCKSIEEEYNELIAEEIALQLGIPCAHYDLASYNDFIGTISENFIESEDKYTTMEQILKQAFGEKGIEKYNNLEDIWIALSHIYKNSETVRVLMSELINIFIFDILIGNIDRHIENTGIVENEYGIHFAKVFDNEKMLSDGSINSGIYSIGIDRSDYHPTIDGYNYNLLGKFLDYSSNVYKEYIDKKLEIISEDNIEEILNRVEERTNAKIQPNIREGIKTKFKMNFCMIEQTLSDRKLKIKK